MQLSTMRDAMARGQAENDMQTAVRMPRGLYEQLQTAAGKRPVGEEIRRRLIASLLGSGVDDPRFRDPINAIGEAASVAIKSVGNDTEGEFDAYAMFEAAVPLLLEVFRPEGSAVGDKRLGIAVAAAALNTIGKPELIGRLIEPLIEAKS
jgi:hypothetical protein